MATRRLYRSRHGKLLGICQGIADWKDFPVGVIRLLFIIITICTAVAPCIIIYLLAAFFIPVEPDYTDTDYDNLKDRVDRMEREQRKHQKEDDWDKRFSEGK